jgi:type I restriction enzyme S subunit
MMFDESYPAVYASFLIRIRFTENTLLPAYYWHFAQSSLYWTQANKLVSKAGQPQFNANVLKSIIIPFPPLSIQREIVRILDSFTELATELATELTARKKQYEYYRNELLTFGDDVPMIPLGIVTTMKAGKFIQASDISSIQDSDFRYPCYGGNGLRGFVRTYNHDGTFSLIGRQGALCGNVKRVQGKFYATEHAVVVDAGKSVNTDWLFHVLTIMTLNYRNLI